MMTLLEKVSLWDSMWSVLSFRSRLFFWMK